MVSRICAANLGPKQKRMRLFFGVFMFVAASVLAVYLMWIEAAPLLKGIVFPFFFMGLLGFFQAKEKTCVVFAAQGIRNLDNGPERIQDSQLAGRLRRQGQKILVQAVFMALLLTFLCVILR